MKATSMYFLDGVVCQSSVVIMMCKCRSGRHGRRLVVMVADRSPTGRWCELQKNKILGCPHVYDNYLPYMILLYFTRVPRATVTRKYYELLTCGTGDTL